MLVPARMPHDLLNGALGNLALGPFESGAEPAFVLSVVSDVVFRGRWMSRELESCVLGLQMP